jgi:hypothetical protein
VIREEESRVVDRLLIWRAKMHSWFREFWSNVNEAESKVAEIEKQSHASWDEVKRKRTER